MTTAQRYRDVYESSTQTRVLVSFHTDEPGGFEMTAPAMAHAAFGKVIGLTTQKAFGGASGKWTLTVKKIDRIEAEGLGGFANVGSLTSLWDDAEQVWARIYFLCDGQRIHLMTGQVDNISETTARTGLGARSETYTIIGRDHGKVFEVFKPFVNVLAVDSDPAAELNGVLQTYFRDLAGTPEYFVRMLIEVWLRNAKAYAMPQSLGGGLFYDVLNLQLQKMRTDVHGEQLNPNLIAIDNLQGQTLWAMLQNMCHGLLNEMWVDLVQPAGAAATDFSNMEPAIFLRERPFPYRDFRETPTSSPNRGEGLASIGHTRGPVTKTRWNRVREHLISLGDTQSFNATKGGSEHRYNYWILDPAGLTSESFGTASLFRHEFPGTQPGEPGNNPIYSRDSISRHGLRPWKQTSNFIPARDRSDKDTSAGTSFVRMCALWLQKLHDWYVVAPFELSGSLKTTRVRPEIRIGDRVRVERPEGYYHFYVEGIQHTWQFPNAGSSLITITRGEQEGRELLDVVYDAYYAGAQVVGDVKEGEDNLFVVTDADGNQIPGEAPDASTEPAVPEGTQSVNDANDGLVHGQEETTANPLSQDRLEQDRPIDVDEWNAVNWGSNDPLEGL